MVLMFLAIGLILGVAGFFMYHRSKRCSVVEAIGGCIQPIGWSVTIVAVTIALILTFVLLDMSTIDKKLEMYQEENGRIEQQIADIVEQYQEYETGIFTELAPSSSMTMVALYPELKSDALVQTQIEVHTANNEKIKELKLELINKPIIEWVLYFG